MKFSYMFALLSLLLFWGVPVIYSINLEVPIKGFDHVIFYEIGKVEFHEVDPLSVMYHAQHLKRSGDALASFLHNLKDKNTHIRSFFVKNVDITYYDPLIFPNSFKLIGTITGYGNTSAQVTIYGISNFDISIQQLRKRLASVGTGLVGYKEGNSMYDKISVEEEKKFIEDLKKHNKCTINFKAVYTVVKVTSRGTKESIDYQRKKFPSMTSRDLNKILEKLC